MYKLATALAAIALTSLVCAPLPAEAARVRVHHGHTSSPEPIKLDIPDLPAIDYKGLVNADALTIAISQTPLLTSAAAGAKSLGNLKRGQHLKKLGVEGGYYRVLAGNKQEGYIIRYAAAMGIIELAATKSYSEGFVVISAPKTKVYKSAATIGSPIAVLDAKAKVPHLFSMGKFFKVKTPSGQIGWIEKTAGTVSAK